jgi:hypothetical protein
MTLDSNGLGIGIENPASNIHVMGQAVVSEQLMIGGLSSSSSNLSILGSLGTSTKRVVSDVSLNEHSVFFADSSGDNLVLDLPYAGNAIGRIVTIKKINAINSIWLFGGGNIIDETEPLELPTTESVLPCVQVYSDGTKWHTLSELNTNPTVAADNLVGWWRLDSHSGNTFLDSSGYGNDAEALSMAVADLSVSSKISNGVAFDGVNDVLEVSNSNSLMGMSQMSVSLWVYLNEKNNFEDLINYSANNTSNTNNIYRLLTNDNADQSVLFGLWTIDGNDYANAGSLALLTWYHLLITYDGQNLKIYVNSVLNDTSPLTGEVQSYVDDDVTLSFGHGTHVLRDNNAINAVIDDVRIYNRALSADEVNALYLQGQ